MSKKNILIIILLIAALVCLQFYLRRLPVKPKEKAWPKVAIVIDDWGYSLSGSSLFKEAKIPLTISILPNLRYSAEIARIARANAQEIILHLPLEPETKDRGYIKLEKNTITSQMSEEQVLQILAQACNTLAPIRGVSNHMGSRATQDKQLMSTIFAELKKRKLFFLDNLVIDGSICSELAKEMKVGFISRDIFLDNSDDLADIKEQFNQLTEFALQSGTALAVGHARPNTLKVLKEAVPLMQKKGIRFTFASDLVK